MEELDNAVKGARPRGTDCARVIQVIETKALRGTGTEHDKCRIVTQYWDFSGNMLAESDICEILEGRCKKTMSDSTRESLFCQEKKVAVSVNIETANLDEAIVKAKELVALLREANELTNLLSDHERRRQ